MTLTSPTRIVLARHGETELNRLGVVQGSGMNADLNDTGEAQARKLGEALRGQDVRRLVSSNMRRAQQTARLAQSVWDSAAAASLTLDIDARLREIAWGTREGLKATPELREEYEQLVRDWEAGRLDARVPGGESAQELAVRLHDAWQDLSQCAENIGGTTVVVMHGRALRCMVCIVEGRDVRYMNEYEHANGGYYVAALGADGRWSIDGGLRNAPAEQQQAITTDHAQAPRV